MHRYVLTLLLLVAGAGAWAQDNPAEDEAETRESEETVEDASAEEEDDLDEESYLDTEEEDFVPTEDIPADQAIPFPTDI